MLQLVCFRPSICYRDVDLRPTLFRARLEKVHDVFVESEGTFMLGRDVEIVGLLEDLAPFALLEEFGSFGGFHILLGHGEEGGENRGGGESERSRGGGRRDKSQGRAGRRAGGRAGWRSMSFGLACP
jgi:hypothetical protein